MGKAKLAALEAKYGPNPCNLNPNEGVLKEYMRAQKWASGQRKMKTKLLRNLRKYQRDLVAKKRKALKIVAFGYWKEWFKEGKIGMEEDHEANLVHD